jgi:chaperonin GroEL (HSP60 family)
MKEAGILDSLHVVKNSLLDATSVGTMLLTTEVSIVNEKVYFRNFHVN